MNEYKEEKKKKMKEKPSPQDKEMELKKEKELMKKNFELKMEDLEKTLTTSKEKKTHLFSLLKEVIEKEKELKNQEEIKKKEELERGKRINNIYRGRTQTKYNTISTTKNGRNLEVSTKKIRRTKKV
jgi:hypothetical protein